MMKFLFYNCFFFAWLNVHAQHETDHWAFGVSGGLEFTTGIPLPEPGNAIMTYESASAISDPLTGNLLMYSDGLTIYDATHNPMPNGSGLTGHTSTTQGCLIVPQPGSSTRYYVFTADAYEHSFANGCAYSVVDMSLNGGLGDVIPTQKNVVLFAPNSEQLSAVKHANCTDWWIMCKELDNNVYRAYQLTGTGLLTPVISTIGMGNGWAPAGQAKFSPDGSKYASNLQHYGASDNNTLAQLFDFDNATGELSNALTLVFEAGTLGHGISFSPDNSKLYLTYGPNADGLHQFDLSSGVPATILASNVFLGNTGLFAALQLAIDHKIYKSGSPSFSVINNPNAAGTACGVSFGTVPVSGISSYSICNFPESFFNPIPCTTPALMITASGTNTSCNKLFDGTAWVQVSGSVGAYDILWSPGDSVNDTIYHLSPGTYTATVTDAGGNSATTNVTVSPGPSECPFILVPNIITPNGDGVNDVFRISGLPALSQLNIFNRWGNPVLITNDYQNDWKGDPDGVYYYVLTAPTGEVFSGFVQVTGN